MDFEQYNLFAFAMNMLYLIVTLLVLYFMLWFFNRSLKEGFGRVYREQICKDPMSAAVYHGLRLVALGILASAFLR